MSNAYDFSFNSIEGEPLPLSSFKGKPVLVVNVASRAQSAAAPDQILITAAVREKAAATLPESAGRDYQLKGIDAPARLWAA